MEESDKKFYARADAVINLANEQLQADSELTPGDISASGMFGVARYNAYASAIDFDNARALSDERDEIIRYFVDEYRKALEDHLDDYIEHFDDYLKA